MATTEKECMDCGIIYSVDYDVTEEDIEPLFCPFCSAEDSGMEEVNFDK